MWWLLALLPWLLWLRRRQRTEVQVVQLRAGSRGTTVLFPGLYMSPKTMLHLAPAGHRVLGVRLAPGEDFNLADAARRVRLPCVPDRFVAFSMGAVLAMRVRGALEVAPYTVLYAPAGHTSGGAVETLLRAVLSAPLLGALLFPRALRQYPTYGHRAAVRADEIHLGERDCVHPGDRDWENARVVAKAGHWDVMRR